MKPSNQEPAYVLHTYPFRETSLIVEVFSRHAGRLSLIAKGARRPRSALRGTLMAFQPLMLNWAGKGDLPSLTKAEWQGGMPHLVGLNLMCGFYLNELLMRLLAHEDPHETLFDDYHATVSALTQTQPEPALRRFEVRLLQALGYGLLLDKESNSDAPIHPQRDYTYHPHLGAIPLDTGLEPLLCLSGQTLLDIKQEKFERPQTLQQTKALMRMLLQHHLGDRVLQSRVMFTPFQRLLHGVASEGKMK